MSIVVLTKTPLAIQFAQGVDTKTDAKLVAPTKLTDLRNAVFLKNGSLGKRNGYRALSRIVDETQQPYIDPQGISKRGSEVVLFANGSSYSYRPPSNTWQTIGAVSSIVASANPIARTGTDQTVPDVAINNGVAVLAWEDNRGGVWASIVEATTLRILAPAVQLDASGIMPRCLAVGEVLHVLWINGSTLRVSIVNPSSPTAFTAQQIISDDLDVAHQGFDAVATLDAFDAGIKPAALTWITPTGYRIGYLHPTGVLGSPVTKLPTVADYPVAGGTMQTGIAIAFTAGNIGGTFTSRVAVIACATFGLGAFYSCNVVDGADLSSSLAAPALGGDPSGVYPRITAEWDDYDTTIGFRLWWAAEKQGGTADTASIQYGHVDVTPATSTLLGTLRGHQLASRAFADANGIFVSVVHPVLYFPYVAVVQLDAELQAQARLLPGLSSGALTRSVLPSVPPIDPDVAPSALIGPPSSFSRQHAIPLGYRIQLGGTSGTQFGEQGVQLFSLDFNHADSFHAVELGRNLYLAGALIQSYDGQRWAEHNFHCAPDTASGTIGHSIASGGSLGSGTYGYKIIYEEIDAQGELHPGPSSVELNIVTSGSLNQVTLSIPACRLTAKKRVRIGVFRSRVDDASAFFRVSSVDPTATGTNGYLANDPTVDTLTFVDGMSDATAQTLEPMYTNGGILSNDPEQSGGVSIVGGKTRLFWLDPLDGNLVNYSQSLRDDTAAEMSAALSVRIDPFGGDVVALAVMDDNVVVFKKTAIFAFGGPGPDADGGLQNPSNAWTQPQLVTTDVGCSSPSSVANVPDGIVFQSPKGPVLLGRDLQIKMIGDDVFAYRQQHISRATLLPDRPHIVFLTDADQGRTLLFDYNRGQWSTFTNHTGIDALVIDGSYYYLGTDGIVYVETPGIYKDGTRHIKRTVETAWIRFADFLQGWQCVLHAVILGTYYSSHQLAVSYRLDYEDGYRVLNPVDVDAVYAPSNYGTGNYGAGNYSGTLGANTVYQQSFHLNRRCQAISFRIEDAENADSYGAAFDLSELLLIGGTLGPRFPVGPARQQ